ncbi:excinuclease ABC subunit UvrA [Streptoalloteichus hindustanus]|uniref:UvrABC system protein A n=1 Tax=Streptoalloteichus hindustanus TaxID=2017 RepID=A0A1M5LXW2_STRHI|nr:excinuclease ABC subunit UvrA [Streptoalloteichus hindustanus]SHG69770.1 excinuclease ABC subunit A [Streptoalloteichus hindustanus]
MPGTGTDGGGVGAGTPVGTPVGAAAGAAAEVGEWIDVVGARTHNLRDVTVRIPRGRIVAFTGVSGSGKTSLAIDTVHAEAQLRYLEGLSPFVRQYVTPRDRPQVDRILNLGATLAVDQRKLNRNARSTIGTMTGIDAYLGLVYSRLPRFATGSAEAPLTSTHFDRHSPEGSCPACHGSGGTPHADPTLIITRPDLPLLDGASPWYAKLISPEQAAVPSVAEHYGVDLGRPWRELPERFRHAMLHGTGDEAIDVSIRIPNRNTASEWTYSNRQAFRGALAEVERLFAAATTDTAKQRYARFMRQVTCPDCAGSGFGEVARSVKLGGLTYLEVVSLPVNQVRGWVDAVDRELTATQREIADTLLPEIASRLRLLTLLGLSHVQISRDAPSLSGGELQRARVAAQLGTALTGIIFVLDEPSSGLHPADKEPLFEILVQLRDAGNTVLLVEHDPELVRRADWVIDIGPLAGRDGGRLVVSAPPAEVARHPESLTGRYLDRGVRRAVRERRPVSPGSGAWLTLRDVAVHNVRVDRVAFPLGRLTCITGVSGSGKSSLLHRGLAAAARAGLDGGRAEAVGALTGLERLDWVTVVDQDPIGRTPRSNPATYTKAFDAVRQLFAGTAAAKARGLTSSSFSFNSEGGRCEVCRGYGRRLVEMHFLPDVWVTCDACDGRRFRDEVLAVTYQGMTVDQVLALTVDDAVERLTGPKALATTLRAMQRVGLGYLQLGQSATELSGGEAQRLKLASAIMRGTRGESRGLVILDEPVTGLHPANVQCVVDAFEALLASGNTVVVAEHDLHFAGCADWIVDMGPGAGVEGGRLVNEGTARDVAAGEGPTARHLRRLLETGQV